MDSNTFLYGAIIIFLVAILLGSLVTRVTGCLLSLIFEKTKLERGWIIDEQILEKIPWQPVIVGNIERCAFAVMTAYLYSDSLGYLFLPIIMWITLKLVAGWNRLLGEEVWRRTLAFNAIINSIISISIGVIAGITIGNKCLYGEFMEQELTSYYNYLIDNLYKLIALLFSGFLGAVIAQYITKFRLPRLDIQLENANGIIAYWNVDGMLKYTFKSWRFIVKNRTLNGFLSRFVYRETATNCTGYITFKKITGEEIFTVKGRWVNTPQLSQISSVSRIERIAVPYTVNIRSGKEELLDGVVQFIGDDCAYSWSNESYAFDDLRPPHYKLEPGEYLLKVTVYPQNGPESIKEFKLLVTDIFLDTSLHNKSEEIVRNDNVPIKMPSNASELRIVRAIYWTPRHYYDVTEELRQMIVDNKISISVTNDIKGDPEEKEIKKLTVRYLYGDMIGTKKIDEYQTLILP